MKLREPVNGLTHFAGLTVINIVQPEGYKTVTCIPIKVILLVAFAQKFRV